MWKERAHLVEELGEVAARLLLESALEVHRLHNLLVEIPGFIRKYTYIQMVSTKDNPAHWAVGHACEPDIGMNGRPEGRVAYEAAQHMDTPRTAWHEDTLLVSKTSL
jgi:hypothetical protein